MRNLCCRILMGALLAWGWSQLRGGEPVMWNENGHYYEVVAASGLGWQSAKTAAEARTYGGRSGHLVTITSASEQAFVQSLIAGEFGGEFWAGGYQDPLNQSVATEGWTWLNNEGRFPGVNSGPGYANWSSGEPNDAGTPGLEQYLVINHWAGGWNDESSCLGCVAGYVVEYDGPPQIKEQPKLVVLSEGQASRIAVEVTGVPLPQVQWFYNGSLLSQGTNATLVFPSTTRAMEGTYRLVASNALGQATSAPIAVVVSNVDPARFVALRWPGRAEAGLILESTDRLGAGAAWLTRSNYPPAAAEQRFVDLEAAPTRFFRLSASGSGPIKPPLFTGTGFVNGWWYTDLAGTKHQIEYVTAGTAWTNWVTLTNLVLPASPYLYTDEESLANPERVYRTTPAP